MKYLLIGIIKIYQLIPGPWHDNCRYTPTCSQYYIESLIRFGALKGSIIGIKRILRCNPWGKMGYDPVPKKEKK
jgi:putative membrane protein insertion efficiency factor